MLPVERLDASIEWIYYERRRAGRRHRGKRVRKSEEMECTKPHLFLYACWSLQNMVLCVACDASVDADPVLEHGGAGAAPRKVYYRVRHFGIVVISTLFVGLLTPLAYSYVRQKFKGIGDLALQNPKIFLVGAQGARPRYARRP